MTKFLAKVLVGKKYGSTLCSDPTSKTWVRVQRSQVSGAHDANETNESNMDSEESLEEINEDLGVDSMYEGHMRATRSALNSTTFLSKTTFSQEKYLRKKHDKYSKEVTVLKPTLLDFCESHPSDIRGDMLSSLLRFAGVRYGSVCGVIDDTNGTVVASLIQKECQVDRYVLGKDTGKEKAQCTFGLDKSKLVNVIKDFTCNNSYDSVIVANSGSTDTSIGEVFEKLNFHIKLSGTFVAYSRTIEPLLELLYSLRQLPAEGQETRFINVQLTEQMLREHEILKDRTHPVMNQSASLFHGFILSAIKVAA